MHITRTNEPAGPSLLRRALLCLSLALALVLAAPSLSSVAGAVSIPNCDPSQFTNNGSFDLTAYLLCKNPQTNIDEAEPGAPITVQFSGFGQSTQVEIWLHRRDAVQSGSVHSQELVPPHEGDIFLGYAHTDENGTLVYDFVLPAGLATGEYEIVAQGPGPDGKIRIVTSAPIRVVPVSGSTDGNLPYTGSNSLRLTTIGAALFVLGGIGVWSARRLRSATR